MNANSYLWMGDKKSSAFQYSEIMNAKYLEKFLKYRFNSQKMLSFIESWYWHILRTLQDMTYIHHRTQKNALYREDIPKCFFYLIWFNIAELNVNLQLRSWCDRNPGQLIMHLLLLESNSMAICILCMASVALKYCLLFDLIIPFIVTLQ